MNVFRGPDVVSSRRPEAVISYRAFAVASGADAPPIQVHLIEAPVFPDLRPVSIAAGMGNARPWRCRSGPEPRRLRRPYSRNRPTGVVEPSGPQIRPWFVPATDRRGQSYETLATFLGGSTLADQNYYYFANFTHAVRIAFPVTAK